MKLPRNDPLMVGTSDSWLSMDDVERVNHISTQGKVPPFAYNRLHTNTPWYTKSFPNANIYFPHACILYMFWLHHLFSKDIAAPQEFFIGARTEPRRIINSRGLKDGHLWSYCLLHPSPSEPNLGLGWNLLFKCCLLQWCFAWNLSLNGNLLRQQANGCLKMRDPK